MANANSITWDEYFMGIAMLSAHRSKDPNTKVGACIVDSSNIIVGVGYNGFPKRASNDVFPWEREGCFLDTKYAYVCHAELNAILNSRGSSLENCRIFVDLFPCNECAKAIIQSGIIEVVYLSDKYETTESTIASKKLFDACGVSYRKLKTDVEPIMLNYYREV